MFDVENNTIVICNNNYRMQILKKINKLTNIKFYSLEEFIKSYYFDYDEKSVLYLIKKYNFDYSLACEYLDNLIYIEDKKYNNTKLDFLVQIKEELIDNNLLIFNNRFKKYISDKKIVLYKLNLSKFDKYLLRDISYKSIDIENNNYIPKIYKFDDIEDEVEFVAHQISKLLDSGISINNIKLTNVSDDYINVINRIFGFYNLKIDKFKNIPIISTVIGNLFYSNIDLGLTDALNSIEKYKDTDIYNKIIDICNKYVWCNDIEDLKILIYHDLNNTFIKQEKYTNMIEVIDFKNYDGEDYVFMLGFNQGIIPRLFKDEDYINDSIKPVYMDTTVEKNKLEKDYIIKCIKNIKNLIITYKLKTPFNTFYPSSLIDELGVTAKDIVLDLNTSYSEMSNKIKLGEYIDNLIKFGEKSDKLSILNSNYDIPYNTYSNIFTGLGKQKLDNYINSLNSFNLSYSSMDNYNRCAFRFYIDKILCLKDDIKKFSVTLGSLYHHILELSINKEIDIRYEVYKYIEEESITLTNSNKFFIERTINNLEYLIQILKEQNSYSKLDIIETEKEVKINIKDNINFIGFIDKIMYKKVNNEIIGAIIDYKTYVKKPSLKYIESGIGLQLPTYMYLAYNSYKNIRFAGFYLQNILLDNKSDEEKRDSLKLIGYTNIDTNILSYFDYNYKNSKVISGIKVNNDGSFSKNSLKRMLDDTKIDELIQKTESKIQDTIKDVLDSKFDINPKYDDGNIGCEFCQFRDLCYRTESDFVKITGDSTES